MSTDAQAVLVDAVPLFALAAVYLAAGTLLGRARHRRAVVAVFPAVAVAATVLGALVVHDGRPLGGSLWWSFAATLVALAAGVAALVPRPGAAEPLRPDRADRELGAVAAVSNALARGHDPVELGRVVADEVSRLLDVEFVAIALVDEGAGEARGLVARGEGADLGWWRDMHVDLRGEPSGIASAVFEGAPVQVYDTGSSSQVSRRLAEAVGARSGAWIPIVAEERVIGVLVLATTHEHRTFGAKELEVVQAIASEAGIALERSRSAEALEQALAENRRRLEEQTALLHAAHALTSELELEALLDRLVEQAAALLRADAADCYLFDDRDSVLRCAAAHGLADDLIGFEFSADAGLAGEALRQRRPVRSDDYEHLNERVPSSAYSGFVRALVAPILWSGQARGVLGVGVRDSERVFDEGDAELLGTVAGLAALALRNAESYEERSRQARIQRGFYLIAEVLGQPLSLPQTVAAAAQAASQALGGDAAALLMPGPAGRLTLAGAHELPGPLADALERGLPDSADAIAAAAAGRRVLASVRLEDDDRFAPAWRELAESAGIRSLLAIPIEAPRGEQAAVAVVLFAAEHVFADDDLELARQVGRAASGALERAELYEAERSSRALAQQLARTGSLLATELDPTAVLDEVAEQAPALLEVDACSIRSLEGDELVVATVSGEGTEELVGGRTPSTSWPAGDVIQTRGPVSLPDAAAGRRQVAGEPLLGIGYAAYLGVPLYGREGALHGVLAVYSSEPHAWREEEIEALSALAANASVALSNAELYQRVALEREQSVAILANIADGIVAVDRDGRIVLWNAAAAEITGVPREEAMGRTLAQVLHRELEGGGAGGARLVSVARGGDEIWLSLSEAVMRDPVGSVAGRIYAFRDISSERLVEQMKSDFVSTVSHELRTPLTSIYGFAETLLREDVEFGEGERTTFLSYIARESERLTSIVDALLNVARLDTGDLQVNVAPTDVARIVGEAVSTAEAAVSGNGHRFVVELDESLTAAADAEKLRQILDQLLQNAVDFSPEGGTVTIAARRRLDAVEVSVVDEGIGIPATEQQRIFTKFHRADAAGRAAGGAGLGLFIAQGLVSAMGGRIWVDSAEGRGSSFTFELPAAREGD